MKKQIIVYGLFYGLCGGLLIVVLKLVEYRFLVVEHSAEIYGGLIEDSAMSEIRPCRGTG